MIANALIESGSVPASRHVASFPADKIIVSALASSSQLQLAADSPTRRYTNIPLGTKHRSGHRKLPALRLALDGYLLPHQRFLLSEMLDELNHSQSKIARLEAEIELHMQPFQKALQAWMSMPGIKQRIAWTLVAEVGLEVQAFPSAADLASWVGVCPGNHESAGKRQSGKSRKGNRWARHALCECLGGVRDEEQLPCSAVPSPSRYPWNETSRRCRGPYYSHHWLSPAAAWLWFAKTQNAMLRAV